jgi:diacylglycerol kinase family enzyme
LAISNGKFYGHGLCIAPEAKPDDGIFSVFIAGDVSILDFIRCSGTLKRGKKVLLDNVFYKEAETLNLTSTIPCIFETDGELAGMIPAAIKILPKRIKFLC